MYDLTFMFVYLNQNNIPKVRILTKSLLGKELDISDIDYFKTNSYHGPIQRELTPNAYNIFAVEDRTAENNGFFKTEYLFSAITKNCKPYELFDGLLENKVDNFYNSCADAAGWYCTKRSYN